MRRASVLVAALVLMGTAQAADWHTVHDRAIHRHHLEQNWGKDEGAQSPGSLFYQEYRAEVVEEARERFVESIPAPVVPSSGTEVGGTLYKVGPYAIPTYIVMCESGGNYKAENAVSTASGAYQIVDGSWAGYGGYSHASFAPPAVQDAKAALMWAGGAGASHWAACL